MTATLDIGARVADGRLATVHRGSLGGRAVAVKRARPHMAGSAVALRREARILQAASHQALVPVLGFHDDEQAPALVLGWADGGSVDDLLADGPLGGDEVLLLLRPVAGALGALHHQGVAHLDVTTRNILLAATGPLLIDPAPPGAGTPGFADPAVADGGPPSARSDVFGLAACAHVALTGRSARDRGGLAVGVVLSPALGAVLTAALHRDRRRRPATTASFIDGLEEAIAGTARSRAGRPIGRPVVRSGPAPTASPRTWPFDKWQEEVDAAVARRAVPNPLLTD